MLIKVSKNKNKNVHHHKMYDLSVSRTFEEGFPVDEVSAVGETGSRAELSVFRRSFLRTLVAFRAPGHADGAAAGVHAMPAGNRSPAALVDVCEVTQLSAQVCKHTHSHPSNFRTFKT